MCDDAFIILIKVLPNNGSTLAKVFKLDVQFTFAENLQIKYNKREPRLKIERMKKCDDGVLYMNI